MDKLDKKLEELNKFNEQRNTEKLTKRIYNLDLSEEYISKMSQNHLIYAHVKLHAALGYNKPFNKIEKIKETHDRLIKYMKNHVKVDKLDN